MMHQSNCETDKTERLIFKYDANLAKLEVETEKEIIRRCSKIIIEKLKINRR